MERRPCPTGGKDLPGGAFCEACGVYSHTAAARSNRPRLSAHRRAPKWRVPLAVSVVLAGAFALLFLSIFFNRSAKLEERYQKTRRTPSGSAVDFSQQARPRRSTGYSRSMSVEMQAAANRRLDEALKAAPPPAEPDPKEERRRKKRLARTGLGL